MKTLEQRILQVLNATPGYHAYSVERIKAALQGVPPRRGEVKRALIALRSQGLVDQTRSNDWVALR